MIYVTTIPCWSFPGWLLSSLLPFLSQSPKRHLIIVQSLLFKVPLTFTSLVPNALPQRFVKNMGSFKASFIAVYSRGLE